MRENEEVLVIRSDLLRGLSDLWRTLDEALVQVGAFEEKIKLRLRQDNIARVEWIDSRKESMLKTFAYKHKARPVVVQALAGAPPLIEKNKKMTGERILLQHVFDALKKTVVARSHIRGLFTEVNFRAAVEDNHADFFKKSSK